MRVQERSLIIQRSTFIPQLADQSYVGTALTLQLTAGFTVTAATIWPIPRLEGLLGWRWAFAFLAPGSAMGILAMRRLVTLGAATSCQCASTRDLG
jgi:predicted MFS family arabinose efflux permease